MNSTLLPGRKAFQQTIDGKPTDLYILKNNSGMQVAITNYGGRIVSLIVPDKAGVEQDVVVGFDSVAGYIKSTEPYYGATIGRYGNRIAKGKFTIEGKAYQLPVNNGPNSLHGGIKGFQYVVWDAEQLDDTSVQLTYLSKDGEEGYPGNLNVKIVFTLSDNNELRIEYEATTDQPTIVNLTNHAYYNLNGQGSGDVLDHIIIINADYYTPIDETFIPFGTIDKVENTPFDFRKPTAIGEGVNATNEQIKNGKGFDHNFVLNKGGQKITFAASALGNETGILMEAYTEEPGMQFYSGNFMAGDNTIKGGTRDHYRNAFCFETQHFPDSPNHPNFPTTELKPGEVYQTATVYRFSVQQ